MPTSGKHVGLSGTPKMDISLSVSTGHLCYPHRKH